MPAPDITLGNGEILLTQSVSGLGLLPLDNNILFGTVQLVSDLCDSFVAGDSVMFNPTTARRLVYGTTVYYVLLENNISGTEVISP